MQDSEKVKIDNVEHKDGIDQLELDEAAEMSQKEIEPKDYKKEKYIALYQARTILAKHGTMPERRMCKKQLDRMKKLGIKSV